MYLQMFRINLILVFIYLSFSNHYLLNTNASPQNECYHSNLKTGETWKMVWQDEFESDKLSNWKIDDETEHWTCRLTSIYGTMTNCFRKENVWTTNGLLVMMDKQEKYADRNFTGAMITTEQYFAYGRYEIRAIIPFEQNISVSIQIYNDNAKNIGESVDIYIMHVTNYKWFYPNGSYTVKMYSGGVDDAIKLNESFNSFHLYGIEWDSEKIQFFFDEIYGEAIFLNDTNRVKLWKQLRIQIDVFEAADDATKLDWRCPALLIDHIRVFEKVQLDDLKFNAKKIKNKRCADKPVMELQEQEIVTKKICNDASIGKRFQSIANKQIQAESWFKQNNYWVYLTIILSIIIVALIVQFACQQIIKKNASVTNRMQPNKNIYENREYLEIIA